MKDVVIKKIERRNQLFFAIFSCIAGFIFSGGSIFNNLFPFLPALVSSSPTIPSLFAILGGAIGSLLFSDTEFLLSYVATALYIMLLKALIKLIFKKENTYINCSLAASVSVIKTIFSIITSSFYLPEIVLGIAESFMAAGFCFFFSISLPIYLSFIGGNQHIFTKKEKAALLVSAAAFTISLNSFSVLEIGLGTVFAVFISLAFAYSSDNSPLSLSVVLSAALTMNNTASLPFFSAVPLSILLVVQIKRLGKYAFSSVFMLISALLSLLLGLKTDEFSSILASVIGTVAFAFSPASLINLIVPLSRESENTTSSKIISARLKSASGSLSVLADALEALYPKKALSEELQGSDVFSDAVNSVCRKCRSSGICWGPKYNDTADVMNKMVNSLKMGEEITVPLYFKSACHQSSLIVDEINASFTLKKESRKNEGKLGLVKNAVSESYRSLSFLLNELSDEIETICYCDNEGEILLKNALSEVKLEPISLSALILSGGKTVYEFLLKAPASEDSLEKIRNALSDLRGDKYSVPLLLSSKEGYLYRFSEIENYSFLSEELYLNRKSDDVSGDKICSFPAKYGFHYMLLCDGMGSGKTAAREAEITALSLRELICGGLTFKAAVKTVSSMLLSQTDTESSCAVDIIRMDKYTSAVSIFKAGGAPTLVRQNGRVSFIEASSMPIGILEDEDVFEAKLTLSEGDVIMVLSDGVLENGTDWLQAVLSQKRLNKPQEIKEALLSYTQKNGITFTDDAAIGIIVIEKN
ncbi:MAG: SpoIIE family protein phosphatase [Oscillospiraceae bacterium]|nr:SpoIIE family protein phosphatase [Oscillospiraceae bacterium]